MNSNGFDETLLRTDVAIAFAGEQCIVDRVVLPSTHMYIGRRFSFEVVNGPLFAIEILRKHNEEWPLKLCSGQHELVRIMDKLYVPIPRNPTTTIAVLDACADLYERLIDVHRNIHNITRLLDAIAARMSASDTTLTFLDFGCGTGLSVRATIQHPLAERITLYGLDAAPHMCAIAAGHGLQMLEDHVPRLFDGIFASYVVHGGLSYKDCEFILQSLKVQGVFAANWLHGSDDELAAFLDFLPKLRRGRGDVIRIPGPLFTDPIFVYQIDEH